MATPWMKEMTALCDKLGVTVPAHVSTDQNQTNKLLRQIVAKVNGDIDVMDATAAAEDIATGKIAYGVVDGMPAKLVGSMPAASSFAITADEVDFQLYFNTVGQAGTPQFLMVPYDAANPDGHSFWIYSGDAAVEATAVNVGKYVIDENSGFNTYRWIAPAALATATEVHYYFTEPVLGGN